MFFEKIRIWHMFVVAVVFTMVFALFASAASANGETFNISVYHGINGKSLGLSKALPVEATVYLDGSELAVIPLEFKDTFEAELPAGEYTIMVRSLELNAPLPSMTVGPVEIPAGVDVSLHAKLSGGKTPILKAKIK